jgi:DNA end-binding protein Ku
MPTAIWTGSISFGLVTVPVRLVSATRSQDVRFHQLEAETGARIRYRRVSEQTGEEVPNDQIVKGYELESGHYVVIEGDELAALKPKANRQIEIEDFVDLSEIDPIYFEQPYYLVPDKDAAKAYRLLAQVMEDEGKVAVGRFVLRSKEALVAIRPVDGMLCLETMRYADEVLAPDREQIDTEAEPSERELDMARQLVSTLAGQFDPEKYRDEYREEVLALIDRKAAGEEIVAPATPEEPAKVLDLMAALEASLARTGAKQGADSRTDERPAQAAARKTRARKAPAKTAAKKSTAKKAAPAKRARKSA